MKHFKSFLAAMLLLLGSNYVGATDWETYAANPPAAGNYYLYNVKGGCFIAPHVGTSSLSLKATTDINQALLFTLTGTDLTSMKIRVAEQYFDQTWYMQDGDKIEASSPGADKRIALVTTGKKFYSIQNANETIQEDRSKYLYASGASVMYSTCTFTQTDQRWYFIPAASIHNLVSVTGLNANGSMTIDTPTGSATGEVKFNVSGDGPVSAFTITMTGGDGHFVMGTATRSGNVITVPVTYTAQNRHSGTTTPASTATVTITAKNTGATTASGTVSAYVDLEPRFALTVSSLDWSHTGLDGEEIFYKGQEIAASQRDRLANKLVYNDENTTGTAKSNATWTATIQGTNANQFKFANGTQSVSGVYTASLLDVIYAPTTTGTHNATLHIVTSYKDASNHTETVEHDIALSGKGSAEALIAFAKAGNQLPTNAETHDFGEIIGTNHQDITADLIISQVTDLQKVWSDPDGAFDFDLNSVNLALAKQTLTFSAHRKTPATANTIHTATLTISGTSTVNSEPVSATITLTYTAMPLTKTTVTWNWATIRSGLTAYNPITTNSDGVWTLTRTVGDKITYDPETKSATAEYTHHEPGITAEFALSIPQTATYTALDTAFDAAIDASSADTIKLTTTAQFDDPSVMTHKILSGPFGDTHYAEFEPTQNKLTIYDDAWVEFMTAGQNTISFHYDEDDDEIWTVTEYYDNNTSKVIYQDVTLTSDTDVTWNFSPNATKIRIEETGEAWGDNGYFTNVKIYEYEALAASEEIIALMDNSGTVSSRNVTLTMANKRQVTATLNETAAQYFTIAEAAAAGPAAPTAPTIELTEEIFNNSDLVAFEGGFFDASAGFEDDVLTIYSWIEFTTAGQNRISFHYVDGEGFSGPTDPRWTFKEYVGGAWNVIGDENMDVTSNQDATWSFSPTATKIRIEQSQDAWGDFTNVSLYTEAPASAAGGEPVSSMVFGDEDGLGFGKVVQKSITVALKEGANVAEAKAASAGNACQLIIEDDYIYDHEVLTLPIAIVGPCDITYKHSANGTYQIAYPGDVRTILSSDYNKHITETDPAKYIVTLSAPTPASGYQFQGWKINDATVSCKESFTTSVTVSGSVVEAAFVAIEAQNFKVGDVYFADLGAALTAAGTSIDSKIATQMQDVTLETGSYTVPAGVTLLVPHKANFFELQETPEVVGTIEVLSAYRTLTLKEGVTITCNGNICISGKLMSAGGGNKSAYTTGECGVINMANGGHIELNDGAHLFCWGYIKGQDMDQGNNTVGTGTVTANSGATVWENFELGDWRGGTASFNIYYNNETEQRKLFPFQSYALQNVEIPTSFMHGSTLRTFTSITTQLGHHDAVFSMVGPENTMFLLTDEQSVVRMWYDPTTDLSCYELSGTAKLDALHVTVYVDMSSENFILPISNSMHIILKDCNMNLANPLMVQAGAIVEIKPSATVNLTSELYLYDVDQWGKYVHNYYFRSFNNLSSHKDRGAENSKAGLDDAKLIVDGIFNVQNGGKLYTTAGGANVMGNGGGQISFKSALPADNILWAVTVLSGAPYINWVYNDVKAANLCNEDGSYTRSIGGNNTFYNINGRWFHEEDKDEQEDHTYWFTYMADGNSGADVNSYAVYSHDKTGLEARMKWFNVAEDGCTNWWIGTNPDAFYNYTMLNDWHQFMPADGGMYSGSNNTLYTKDGCDWTENGAVDENCLYTFGEEKKALVDGEFIPLTSNGYDPAYHATANASQYYICFTGCNWHPAMPYVGESKAYTIHPEDEDLHYIWFNSDWLNVLRDEPFFYTEDEITNVRTYYEYVNGEWEIATPYVSVTDAAETRTFYMIKEAFNVAQIKKNATITLLRDLPNVSEVLTYSTQNTTCTLDLNGHVLGGNVANLVTVNAPGCTFTITDNAALKIGKISNSANKAVYAQKGTVVLNNGTLEATGANAIACASAGAITINGGYLSAATKCVNVAGSACTINGGHFTDDTGLATYCAAHKYPFETADPKYQWEVSDAWTITFKDGTTTIQTLHLKPGETPVYTAAQPTKENQHFIGWSPAIVAAIADATYTAQFEAIGENKSCVTLNSNGGVEGLQYVYVTTGSAIGTVPEGTTKEGYTFAGWWTTQNGGTQMTAETTISGNVTYYAHYTVNQYTLTWDANGGELSGSYTSGLTNCGAAITAPTATLTGHTFIGWNITPAATMPAHDVTYTAQWSVAAKHYLQNIDGTYPETPVATDNVTGEANGYVTPATKTYDGFITPATQTVQIGVTTEVTYQYARRTYTITLNANGGTCATTSLNVKHGATLSLPTEEDITKEGYTFDGWFTKAVGGDKITNETVILYNIGTLYAHFTENIIVGEHGSSVALTITEPTSAHALIIEKDGRVNIVPGATVTVDEFVLESNGVTSGQLLGTSLKRLTVTAGNHANFHLALNAHPRNWYAVAVPWEVNAESGIFNKETGAHLILGRDFDIIYYKGDVRAASGPGYECWQYVEDDGDKTLVPGRLYQMYFAHDVNVVRFQSVDNDIFSFTPATVYHDNSYSGVDANWAGIANPKPFHAHLAAGGAVYGYYLHNTSVDDYMAKNGNPYQLVTMNSYTAIVGKPFFIQTSSNAAIVPTATVASVAPRRMPEIENEESQGIDGIYEISIEAENQAQTDHMFVQIAAEKEDTYVIGQDLLKLGVSENLLQMWVNRYNQKLAVNTAAPMNSVYTYPLSINIPQSGEYTIAVTGTEGAEVNIYLTKNNSIIWNLSNGNYVGNFETGLDASYGLRIVANAPQIVTGIEGALMDANGEIRKVLIDNQVYIIRGNNIYSVDGQIVK